MGNSIGYAIWGYQHGFYSRAGSAHEMIPAMAAAYGLKCQGAGTDYNAIKKALKRRQASSVPYGTWIFYPRRAFLWYWLAIG